MPYYISDNNPDCSGWATEKDDGEVMGCHGTKQAAIDQMVALSLAEDMEPGGERAAPDALSVGDFVSWNSSGGRARGRIERIERDGSINIPNSDFTVAGTEDDPAALIRVYRPADGGWSPSDVRVGHKFSTLTKIDPLPEPDSRDLPDNYRPALAEDVPEGRACGNCMFFDESNIQGDMAWCQRWEEYVRGGYYCNAWQGREDRVDSVPEYIQTAAARGLELNREGFGGDGLTEGTLREARAMARGQMSDDKAVRANAWAARHAVDLNAPKNSDPDNDEWPGAGAVAHYLWGINPLNPEPARRWLERQAARIKDERHTMTKVEMRKCARCRCKTWSCAKRLTRPRSWVTPRCSIATASRCRSLSRSALAPFSAPCRRVTTSRCS